MLDKIREIEAMANKIEVLGFTRDSSGDGRLSVRVKDSELRSALTTSTGKYMLISDEDEEQSFDGYVDDYTWARNISYIGGEGQIRSDDEDYGMEGKPDRELVHFYDRCETRWDMLCEPVYNEDWRLRINKYIRLKQRLQNKEWYDKLVCSEYKEFLEERLPKMVLVKQAINLIERWNQGYWKRANITELLDEDYNGSFKKFVDRQCELIGSGATSRRVLRFWKEINK